MGFLASVAGEFSPPVSILLLVILRRYISTVLGRVLAQAVVPLLQLRLVDTRVSTLTTWVDGGMDLHLLTVGVAATPNWPQVDLRITLSGQVIEAPMGRFVW